MNPNVSYNTGVELTNQSVLVNTTSVMGQQNVPQNLEQDFSQKMTRAEKQEMAAMFGMLEADIKRLMASRGNQVYKC